MAEFEDAQSWKKDGDSWAHKGGGFVPYKLPPKGVFTFTAELLKGGGVFRAGPDRLVLPVSRLQELPAATRWIGRLSGRGDREGQAAERVKAPLNLEIRRRSRIQIDVTPDRLVQKVRVGDEWKVLDTFVEQAAISRRASLVFDRRGTTRLRFPIQVSRSDKHPRAASGRSVTQLKQVNMAKERLEDQDG